MLCNQIVTAGLCLIFSGSEWWSPLTQPIHHTHKHTHTHTYTRTHRKLKIQSFNQPTFQFNSYFLMEINLHMFQSAKYACSKIFLMSSVKMCVLRICISRLNLKYMSTILRPCALLFPPYATSLHSAEEIFYSLLHSLMAKLLCTCKFDSRNIQWYDVQISANHWYVHQMCRSTYHNDISTIQQYISIFVNVTLLDI